MTFFFYFGPVGPNMEISSKAPQKGITSSLFLPTFNWQHDISKMVSLSIRWLRELNLCEILDFRLTGPNMEIRAQKKKKR